MLPSSEQPVSWLCTWSPDSTQVEVWTPGPRVLPCSLKRTVILSLIGFTMPLLPLPGSTGQGLWVRVERALLSGEKPEYPTPTRLAPFVTVTYTLRLWEPLGTLSSFRADSRTVWRGTQAGFGQGREPGTD